jgi:hypothetical protein
MTDVDAMLAAMRTVPSDARLADIDGAVMAGVARRHDRKTARHSLMLAGLLAAGVGWAGSYAPPARASVSSIGQSDYAPSRLLGQ